MAFCTLQFYGESIQKTSSMNIILPEKGKGPFAVLYLLHGLSDNHTAWARQTGLERFCYDESLIVVMPDAGRSWYCNDPRPGGLAYEDHIIRDVVEFVDKTFSTIRSRWGRAIAGLSMGGYGAIMLGLRHPDLFSAISSHSGALGFAHEDRIRGDRHEVNEYARAVSPDGEYSLWNLATRAANSPNPLAIRFDCGSNDELLSANHDFHEHLEKLGIPHQYDEFRGGHNWAYWTNHIYKTLRFAKNNLLQVDEAKKLNSSQNA